MTTKEETMDDSQRQVNEVLDNRVENLENILAYMRAEDGIEKLEYARKIADIDEYIDYFTNEDGKKEEVDFESTDRDRIDEAVREQNSLDIEPAIYVRKKRGEWYDPEDFMYEITLAFWWPNVTFAWTSGFNGTLRVGWWFHSADKVLCQDDTDDLLSFRGIDAY